MKKMIDIQNITAVDIIEPAKNYYLLPKNNIEKAIFIGGRKRLSSILFDVPLDMVIATYGTYDKCIILLDYQLGELMDIISAKKAQS